MNHKAFLVNTVSFLVVFLLLSFLFSVICAPNVSAQQIVDEDANDLASGRTKPVIPVPDGEHIVSFDTSMTINSDASVRVIEEIEYDFGQQKRRGIYREIPYKYKARGGNFSLNISDIIVRDSKQDNPKTKVTRSNGRVVIRVGDENVFINGRETYTIGYTVKRAINFFDQHDELYWNVTGDEWKVPIMQSSAVVQFEEGLGVVNSESIKNDCFVGRYGSNEKCSWVIAEDRDGVLRARPLAPGEGFTIVTGFPKGIVEKPDLHSMFISFLRDNLILFLPFACVFFMGAYWYRHGRDPEIPEGKSVVARWEIPEIAGKKLSPFEIGIIVDEKAHRKDISSIFISLAIRGYFVIERIEKNGFLGKEDYKLLRRKEWKRDESLREYERVFLDGVFGKKKNADEIVQYMREQYTVLSKTPKDKRIEKSQENYEKFIAPGGYEDEVMLSSLKNVFYKSIEKITEMGYIAVTEDGVFVKNPTKVRWMYYLGAIVVFFILMFFVGRVIGAAVGIIGFGSIIASLLVVAAFGRFMPRKTTEGVRVYQQILGLKKYLEASEKRPIAMTQSPHSEYFKSSATFEKYLPYAMVLGVEDEWAQQFEGIYDARESTWFVGANAADFSAGDMSSATSGFAAAAGAVALSRPSSGGSGFSGGGSGGGGGGGGGGSW